MRIISLMTLCIIYSALASGQTHDCSPEEVSTGCRILNGNCICTQECNTLFPYSDEQSCQAANRERLADACWPNPCGRGFCVQTASHPGYRCYCFGTGSYGERCEHDCTDVQRRRWNDLSYPLECVGV